ncbi:zinc finger protein 16-like [Ochlerotatus camptorhynchus]|uniref:zinc finger protein 16-like n=1 Tax=Ochlerotatus camptorhynchus TaxID=644619 RepID=UPI0031DF6F65
MDFDNVCRLCAAEKLKLREISNDERHPQLVHQLRSILQVDYDENDGLPQKVCKPCINALQKIQDTLDEYRSNDMKMRKQLLNLDEVEVKLEELVEGESGDALGAYSLKNVKIEVLEVVADIDSISEIEAAEEWLEDNSGDEEKKNQANESPTGVKRRRVRNDEFITFEVEDGSVGEETATEDETAPMMKKRQVRKANSIKKVRRKRGTKQPEDPNRPRLNDYKCYICKSEPLGSAKALLDHLSSHIDQLPYTCAICVQETIEIKQIRSLNLHLKMHEQPSKCAYCDRRYANERARDYHVQTYHLGDNAPCPSTCDQCGKVCPSALSLRTHMRCHTISFSCEYCSKTFAQKSKLKRHIVRVHEKTEGYECTICQKRLNTIDAYELHVRTIHEGRRDHECDVCGRRFTTAAFLRMHQKQYEGGVCKPKNNWKAHYTTRINEEGIKLFSCKICNKQDMRAISEHLRVHFPGEHECPVCFAKFPRKSSFDRHRLTHSEIAHSCFSCAKNFLSLRTLSCHLAKVHGIGQILETDLTVVSEDEEIDFDVVE